MNKNELKQSLPLPLAERGRTWRVRGVAGEADNRRRLSELGFIEGAALEVLQTNGAGRMVIRLGGGTRLAVSHSLANQVLVH